MRLILALLLSLAMLEPAEAKVFLVFKKIDGVMQTDCHHIWLSDDPPRPGVEVKSDSVVLELPKGTDKKDWKLQSGRLVKKTKPAVQVVDDEFKAMGEARARLQAAADDLTISDEDFTKMLQAFSRGMEMSDPAAKKQKFEEVKGK